MGRIVDLVTEVAAAADEQGSRLTLSPEAFDRLRDDWGDEEIEDALALAQANFEHQAVVEAADTVSARVIEVLSVFSSEAEFQRAAKGESAVTTDALSTLTRCVSYLEEALASVRDAPGPDRARFDTLVERLANLGIEEEMRRKPPQAPPRKRKSH